MKALSLRIFTLLALVFMNFNGSAQITTTGGLTPIDLASILAGTNITVSNVVYGGSPLAAGSFISTNGFDFESGIILTTGELQNCEGPNNDPNTSDNLGYPGDPQMELLGGANSWDVAWLEFDFLVQSSSVQFEYIFASEDYPEAAPPNNPTFNDVFAFFISGPGIVGEENIALIPGTTDLVTIDNVNPVTNAQYYVDNAGGLEIQFDGYTTPLIAFRDNLIACETYHLKLIISDIHNTNRNSAVFLKENSFVQENVLGVETHTVNSDTTALEGCIPGSFTFEFDDVSNQDRIITYQIAGTAVNGVDYSYLDTSVLIPAGQTTGTIIIDAFADGIPEGQEEIMLIYPSGGCFGLNDTAYLYINDADPIDFTLDGVDLDCFEDNSGQILVNPTGGFPPYTFTITPENGQSFTTQDNPVTGLSAGEYIVGVSDSYGCEAEALVIGGVFDADTTFLPDGTGVTYDAPLVISGFNPGQTITDVSQIQQICLTMEHSYLGDLQIAVESPSGQTVILKQQNGGASCDLGEPYASGPVDGQNSNLTNPGVGYEYCFNANPIYGTMVSESNSYTHTIPSSTGGTYTDNYLPAGSYTPFGNFSSLVGSTMNGTWTVHVTDQFGLDNGYIFNWYISLIGDEPDTIIVLNQPDEIQVSGFVTNSTCGGSTGSIDVSIVGAQAPYTVSWDTGETAEDLTNIGSGTYTITVTDANGCQSSETFIVNDNGSMNITGVVSNVSCESGSDGAIDITVTGGTAPYGISWSNGATTQDISSLTGGTYIVTATDQIGCNYSHSFTVNDGVPIDISLVSLQDEQCNTNNGAINISVSGGSGSYGYQWSNGATTQDINNLNMGTYVVNIVDAYGCTAQESYALTNNLTNCSSFCYLDVALNDLTDETCGSANGSIDIEILNALQPITIAWNNGATTEDINSLSQGSYTVTIVAADNCSTSETFTISNNAPIGISNIQIGSENCGNQNGSINLNVTGGALPYTYNWSNGSTTEDISGLSAGTYTLTITDANNCSVTANYQVLNNSGSLNVSGTINHETCTNQNGSISQVVTGANGTVTYLWNTGATSSGINNLSSGNYSCVITDASGCSTTKNYHVNANSGDISLVGSNITNEQCGNGAGAVNITLTGNNLTYNWSNGATTEDITNLPAGNYSCTVSNSQGCIFETQEFVVLNSSGSLGISTQLITDEVCSNNAGAANMNVTGGQSPFTYLWSNGATTLDQVGLSAGYYTLTVTDANGCQEAHTVQIENTSGTLAIQNAVITNETCGDATGAVNLLMNGGTLPYSFQWSNSASTEDIGTLSAGTYEVLVTDNEGCEVNGSYVVMNNAANIQATGVITNEICSNGQGEINLTVTGGANPYTFNWSNGATTEDVSALSAGQYTCEITDNNGCILNTTTYTVNNTPSGMSASTVVTDATCSNDGAIDLTINGGTSPITIDWSNGATTEDITGLTSGTYTFTISDNNGCVLQGDASVNQTNNGLVHSFTFENDVCYGGNGSIDLTPTGGTQPYTFVWSNGATTEDLSGLNAGNYSCTITDNTGCSVTTSNIQIANSAGTLSIDNLLITNEVCVGANGAIDLVISGGAAPVSFSWSNGATSEDISGLTAGNYSVTVTDNNGCVATSSVTVQSVSGTMAIMQPIVVHEQCSNGMGSINITVQGAVNPMYQWSNGATTQDISNISAGSYTVNITDANGCQLSQTFLVTNSGTQMVISNAQVSDEYCGSGSGAVQISVSGGTQPYSYHWNTGATTQNISGLSAGNYSVTVTGQGGCQAFGTYTINDNSGSLAVNGTVTDETCGDGMGAIDIQTSGGFQPLAFNWSTGSTSEDISGLSAGSYNVTITDNFGCTATFTESVSNITNGIGITVNSVTDENCGQSDGAVDVSLTGSGIVSTTWSSGQTTEDLTGISAGSYTLTIIDNLGCQVSENVTVSNQTGTLNISFSNIGNENCSNGQGYVDIEVAGTGPFTYLWSDGQTTQDATGLSQGSISVTITDALGCDMTQSFNVQNNNATNLTVNELISDSYCSSDNGAIDVTIIGGVSPHNVLWNTGATTEDLSNLLPGTYSITVTDGANCQVTEAFTIVSVNSGLAFSAIDVQNDFCGQGSGSIDYQTSGTVVAEYLDGIPVMSPIFGLVAGTYTLTIEDSYGCSVDSIITVDGDAFFNVNHTATNESCNGSDGAIDISVSGGGGGGGGYTYQWSNGATTQDVSGLAAGTYTVTVTSGGGFPCSIDYEVTIVNNTTFTIAENITDEYCGTQDGAIDLNIVSGSGLQFQWSNGATTEDISGLSAGTYTCVVTDPAPGGCVESFDYTVNAQSNGTVVSADIIHETCGQQNGAINLTLSGGSGNFTYSWSNAEITEDISGLSASTYDVVIVDQNDGCEMHESYVVTNVLDVFGGTGVVTHATCSTCPDGAIDVTLNQGFNYTISWSNGASTEDVSGLTPGTYSITATTENGCDTTMTFNVLNAASIDEIDFEIGLGVYPNPASSSFTIEIGLPESISGKVILTNALGQILAEKDVLGTDVWEVDASQFARGVYFVRLETKNETHLRRVVVQR